MFELTIAAVLIVINGIFALSELAIVSSRKQRLKNLINQNKRGAKSALSLAEDPGKFLSTVQIGITLVGILAGAFSGAALGGMLTLQLEAWGVTAFVAEPLGYAIVISIITFFSVVVGELVPKQLALRNPEAIACMVAPAMKMLSRIGAPVVWLLDASSRLIFHLMGQSALADNAVTEEEIKTLVAEAEAAGVIEDDERRMIGGVLRLSDRKVESLMTPRTEVDWISLTDSEEEVRALLSKSEHSRLPVAETSTEDMIGVVQSRELLAALLTGKPLNVRRYMHQAPIIPETMDALDVLDTLREAEVPMALVHDEYGHFQGVVTPADVLEAITGVISVNVDTDSEHLVRRGDGSWLVSGAMPADEVGERLGVQFPAMRDYHTMAGMLIAELKHLPKTGESVEAFGWRFEVVDMDGHRIDKILAMPG